jgi:hypothetical protein
MTFLVALVFDAVLVVLGRIIMPWSLVGHTPQRGGA